MNRRQTALHTTLRAALIITLNASTADAQTDNCSQILKYGIWEEVSHEATVINSQQFATWACSAKARNKETGTSLDIPGYGALDLEKSTSASSSNCWNSNGRYHLSAAFRETIRTAAPTIANAWLKCTTALGSHASIIYNNESTFSIHLTRNVDKGAAKASVRINFMPEDIIKCTTNLSQLSNGIPFEKSRTIACQRSEPTRAIAIEVNFEPGGGRTLNIPAMQPPRPLPPKTTIQLPVTRITRWENVEVGGGLAHLYGADVLHNAPPYKNFPPGRTNTAEFDFNASADGSYHFEIEYAAKDSRPVIITINGTVFAGGGISATTGSWTNQQWKSQGIATLKEGKNTLHLHRIGVFPHIRTFRFTPTEQ